jgi:hypothetical protein
MAFGTEWFIRHRPYAGSAGSPFDRSSLLERGVILDLHDNCAWVVVIGNGHRRGCGRLGAHWMGRRCG